MKTNIKLIRLVLASSLGSVLWAGCAGPRTEVARTNFDPSLVSAAPVDNLRRRPDTHPEWRSSMWQFVGQDLTEGTMPNVVETTVVQNPDRSGVDSTYLLVFKQEVINVASTGAAEPAVIAAVPGETIVEAAGAERSAETFSGVSSAQERWDGGVITTTIAPAAP